MRKDGSVRRKVGLVVNALKWDKIYMGKGSNAADSILQTVEWSWRKAFRGGGDQGKIID